MPQPSTKTIFKTLLRYVKPHKLLSITIVVSIAIAAALDLLVPWYYKDFFDVISTTDGSNPESMSTLVGILLTIFVIHMGSWVFFRISTFGNNYFQPTVMADIERDCFENLLGHSHNFFSNTFTGSLVRKVRRLSRSFEELADIFTWNLLQLAIVVTGTVIALGTRSLAIAFAVVAWMVVMVGMHVVIAFWKLKYDREKAEQDSAVTGVLADVLTNNANVKLFAAQEQEQARFRKVTDKLVKLRIFTWNINGVVDALQTLLMLAVEFAVLYLGAKLWAEGKLSVGDFAMFQGYLLMLFGKFWDIGRLVRKSYESMADASEMIEILETRYEVQDAPHAEELWVQKGKIEFDHVGFSYRRTRSIFEDLHLTIQPGEKVALVGHSGAGKSTVVTMLLRLFDISSGRILIDGQDIAKVTQNSLRKNVGLVPQDPVLFHRSLLENIRYGRPDASKEEVIEAAKKARCHEFIMSFSDQYDTFVGERGIKLSGGERQRVAIARAILASAPVLILDEATSSLDSESELLIQEALSELMKEKTVIVIAHRLSTILEMDRIIVVDEGKIVDEGTHQELSKKQGIYKTLWDIQAGGFLG